MVLMAMTRSKVLSGKGRSLQLATLQRSLTDGMVWSMAYWLMSMPCSFACGMSFLKSWSMKPLAEPTSRMLAFGGRL